MEILHLFESDLSPLMCQYLWVLKCTSVYAHKADKLTQLPNSSDFFAFILLKSVKAKQTNRGFLVQKCWVLHSLQKDTVGHDF